MSEKIIDRDEFSVARERVTSSGSKIVRFFDVSHITVKNEELQDPSAETPEPDLVLTFVDERENRSGFEYEYMTMTPDLYMLGYTRQRFWGHRPGLGIAEWGGSFFHVDIGVLDWCSQVSSADSPEDVIDLFRQSDNPKFNRIADRLRELQDFYEEDPEGEDPLTIEALRTLALFVGNNPDMPYSHISLSPDEGVYLEWRLHPQGRFAIELSPNKKLVEFAAISATAEEGVEREQVSGTLPEKEAIEALGWFIKRIADNDNK